MSCFDRPFPHGIALAYDSLDVGRNVPGENSTATPPPVLRTHGALASVVVAAGRSCEVMMLPVPLAPLVD